MRQSRRLSAFISGLALYSVAMLISGPLSELHLPGPLLRLFGAQGSQGQLLGLAALYAVPAFMLALGWAYLALRPQRPGRRPKTAWCLAGLALAWLGWLFYGMVCVATEAWPGQPSVAEVLLSSGIPPLWGALNSLAVLAGVLIAGQLVRRQALAIKGMAAQARA